MESMYRQNIASASAANPSLESELAAAKGPLPAVMRTPAGPVPEVALEGKKIYVHSKFDPVTEARRFLADLNPADYDLFIVLGFGFGYHIEELAGRTGAEANVLVIEKDPAMIRAALESRDLAGVLASSRVRILISPGEDAIAAALRGASTRRVAILTHRGSHRLDPEYYHNMRRVAKSYLSTKEVNIATLAKFERTWGVNIARNIVRIIRCPGANVFFSGFSGLPAIVVAAGPSLSESVGFIRDNAGKALIVAVDTAYGVLRKAGIEPHFCVSVDPQMVNARYFEGTLPGRTVLVADPTSHPSAFRLFGGRAAVSGMAFEMLRWIENVTGAKGEIAHGGSVSTNAYDFARQTGASPVVLVGQDLAFTGGRAHVRGSYLDEQVRNRAGRLYTAETFNRFQLTALPKIFVEAIGGGRAHTNQKMMIFLSWFEKRNDPGLINASAGGARMHGVKHMPAGELPFPDAPFDIASRVDDLYRSRPHDEAMEAERFASIAGLCTAMRDELAGLVPALDRSVLMCEELLGMFEGGARDRGKIDYILKKLAETDRLIESRRAVRDMIAFTTQRVIHTITEGYDIDGDETLSEEAGIANRSLFLYRGLLEGALFNDRILKKMSVLASRPR